MAKFICEVEELGGAFVPPPVLYSGTCAQHARDLLRRHGCFKHEAADQPVHLSEEPLTAMSVACRAIFHRHTPLVLVTEAERTEGAVRFDGDCHTDELALGVFAPYGFGLDETGRYSERTSQDCCG